MNFELRIFDPLMAAKRIFIILVIMFCWVNIFSVLPALNARQPTPVELAAIRKETMVVFKDFLQMWKEERYFELYNYGKKHSRDQITIEEFATRMVELDWVPVDLLPEKMPEISYHYRTLIYVNAAIVFRHKSFFDLQFTKQQSFLLLKEAGKWRFDLLQMIRSPFYSPQIR